MERATVLPVTLAFLKLGGSLITDKTRPFTPRLEKLTDLAAQIAEALRSDPTLKLVLGHGSGSFGHETANQYKTQQGVTGLRAWSGFAEVWYQASALNRLVIEAVRSAGLPALTLSPASSVTTCDGKIVTWNLNPLRSALSNGLLPVIHGDVVFDDVLGGTILSTEELFVHLARALRPQRILLAGLEKGVWADFPERSHLLINEITPENFAQHELKVGQSAGVDVTGGMESKVRQMVVLVGQISGLEVLIFSGEEPENIRRTLLGENLGTSLHR